MGIASADTRRRALAAYEQGVKSQSEIAALFGITLRTFQRWLRAWRTEGRDAPGHSSGRPAVFVGPAAERLRREVARQPDATLHELAERLGQIAHYVTVHRALARLELPYKKRRCRPPNKTAPT
ncbi:MAG: helix-turn-helix domain-containing protein [Planctomycetota bacterium]|nr:helix-turn-helix domain-containing protein [Planctomycetota bacterium]